MENASKKRKIVKELEKIEALAQSLRSQLDSLPTEEQTSIDSGNDLDHQQNQEWIDVGLVNEE